MVEFSRLPWQRYWVRSLVWNHCEKQPHTACPATASIFLPQHGCDETDSRSPAPGRVQRPGTILAVTVQQGSATDHQRVGPWPDRRSARQPGCSWNRISWAADSSRGRWPAMPDKGAARTLAASTPAPHEVRRWLKLPPRAPGSPTSRPAMLNDRRPAPAARQAACLFAGHRASTAIEAVAPDSPGCRTCRARASRGRHHRRSYSVRFGAMPLSLRAVVATCTVKER